jgi:acyl dehydratase
VTPETFSHERILNWRFEDVEQAYTLRDTMLYALGLGLGCSPTDPDELRFVYERGLQVFPTMAVVLGHPGPWMANPATGIDVVRVLHGEQHLEVHRPLPAEGRIRGVNRVTDVVDKGPGKGALITIERRLYEVASGELCSTQTAVIFARGNGGFGGPKSATAEPHALPARDPDLVEDLPIPPQAALVYRLSGDYNPLHADPEVARKAGFPAPILHGLATYGMAARALLRGLGGPDTVTLKRIGVRFSAPVFPGETLRTEIWRDAEVASFRARVVERDAVVLNNGYAALGRA